MKDSLNVVYLSRAARRPVVGHLLESLESRVLLSVNHPPTELSTGFLDSTTVHNFPATVLATVPLNFTYADLVSATGASDADGDTLSFLVTSVPAGAGSLTITDNGNTGAAVPNGSFVVSGDALTWTPAGNANGTVTAFVVRAFDGTAFASQTSTIKVATTGLPQVSVTTLKSTAWETQPTTHYGLIQITRTGSIASDQVINFTTASGSTNAQIGTNFILVGGANLTNTSVTIPAGSRSVTLKVEANPDGTVDPTLLAQLTLAPDTDPLNPTYAVSSRANTGTVKIFDENPTISIKAVSGGILEGGANQKAFVLTRTAAPGGSLANLTTTVNVNFTGGTFSSANVVGFPTSVTFNAGRKSEFVLITTTNNGVAQGTKTLVGLVETGVNMSVVSGLGSAAVNVLDASPTVSIITVGATATESGTTQGQFQVRRTGSTALPLTVTLTLPNSTSGALLGTNFLLVDGAGHAVTSTVTIPAGHTMAQVFVRAVDDHKNDALTASISLANNTAYNLLGTSKSTTVTITNLDRTPTIRVTTFPKLAPLNGSITLSYSDLISLMGASVGKGSAGTLVINVGTVAFGTVQVISGGAITTNTTLNPGDTLVWTAPVSTKATARAAIPFTVTDGTLTTTATSTMTVTIS